MAKELAHPVGGTQAQLFASGWSDEMLVDIARVCAHSTKEAKAIQLADARAGDKRKSMKAEVVAALLVRNGSVKEAADDIPELSSVAIRLVCIPPRAALNATGSCADVYICTLPPAEAACIENDYVLLQQPTV